MSKRRNAEGYLAELRYSFVSAAACETRLAIELAVRGFFSLQEACHRSSSGIVIAHYRAANLIHH